MSDQVDALLMNASQARREHRLTDAKTDLLKALEICRSSANNIDVAGTLKALGQIERDMDHAEAALTVYQEAAAIYRTEGDELALAHTIRHVADIEQKLGRTSLPRGFSSLSRAPGSGRAGSGKCDSWAGDSYF